MHTWFLVLTDNTWGVGETVAEARKQERAMHGRGNRSVYSIEQVARDPKPFVNELGGLVRNPAATVKHVSGPDRRAG